MYNRKIRFLRSNIYMTNLSTYFPCIKYEAFPLFSWNPLIPFISLALSVARHQASVVKPRLKLVHLSKWNVLYPCNNVHNASFFIRPGLFCYWRCIGLVVLYPALFPSLLLVFILLVCLKHSLCDVIISYFDCDMKVVFCHLCDIKTSFYFESWVLNSGFDSRF